MIKLENLTLHIGPRVLFDEVHCVFNKQDHIGIIGRNGAGKSMFLKTLAGIIQPTSGTIAIQKGMQIAYLAQEDVLTSNLTVFEEAFHAFQDMVKTEQQIATIEKAIEANTCSVEQLEEYAALQNNMLSFNKHAAVKQTNETLHGLGFKDYMFHQPVANLSVGWKMRLALAKLLLTKADFYLFDEPTNHLDIVTQDWFLRKLQSLKAGFLLVSHDRSYLDKACQNILELERGKATYYRGNLSSYLEQKQTQIEIAKATRARQEKDIAQKQATIERFRYSASKARQAQNLIKKVEKIELVEVEPPLPSLNIKLPAPPRSGNIILQFNDITFHFDTSPIFSGLKGEIHRNERVALIAANGVGKSTFINCLTGTYTLKHGTIKLGHNVTIGYFQQDQAQSLNQDSSIFEELCSSCPDIPELEIRTVLGAFLFSGDDIHKKIKVLSGGEKNRVAMTRLLLQKANFLILDEPTNHLDLYAKDVLCQALQSFQGTMLFVSHDHDFTQKLATRIIELTPTTAYSYPGSYEDFCNQKRENTSKLKSNQKPTSTAKEIHKEQKKDARLLSKHIAALERKITKLEHDEAKQLAILSAHAYGSEAFSKATEQITVIQATLKKVQEEWEEAILHE